MERFRIDAFGVGGSVSLSFFLSLFFTLERGREILADFRSFGFYSRQKAIQSLLLRNVSLLTPSITEFLTTQLEIPPLYLSLSKLTLAQSKGQIFDTYKLSLTCQLPEQAHRIAVEELCPEAVVRGDEGLCRRLLEPFREDKEEDEEEDGTFRGTVEGWEEGGKVQFTSSVSPARRDH